MTFFPPPPGYTRLRFRLDNREIVRLPKSSLNFETALEESGVFAAEIESGRAIGLYFFITVPDGWKRPAFLESATEY